MSNKYLKFALAILWSGFCISLNANAAVHLQSGSTFESEYYDGQAFLTCQFNGRSQTTLYGCTINQLSPYEYDYLVSDEAIDADSVKLSSKVGRRTVNKSSRWDASARRSKSQFNLWIWTLTQSGLLDFGQNTINFEFSKNKIPVSTGSFVVTVNKGRNFRCPNWTIYSSGAIDCQSSSQLVCDEYFRQAGPFCR